MQGSYAVQLIEWGKRVYVNSKRDDALYILGSFPPTLPKTILVSHDLCYFLPACLWFDFEATILQMNS